jgi:hypothetical protein
VNNFKTENANKTTTTTIVYKKKRLEKDDVDQKFNLYFLDFDTAILFYGIPGNSSTDQEKSYEFGKS